MSPVAEEVKAPTYTVMRSRKNPPGVKPYEVSTPVESGLSWQAATALMGRLERAEKEAKPGQTSWTRDVFYREREKS